MAVITKFGPTSGVVPSLTELQAIRQLKQAWKSLVKTSSLSRGTYWSEIIRVDWSDIRRSWRKIRYYRQSKSLTKVLAPIKRSVPSGKYSDEKLKRAIKAYPKLILIWGPQYDHPDKVNRKLDKLIERSMREPVRITVITGGSDWVFKGSHYQVSAAYSDAQAKLLIQREFDREHEFFDQLRNRYNSAGLSNKSGRERIPERIRIEVWRRDGGACAKCGSRENLEYDHIIPVSKGGSNSARNIELLCEKCNRSKSANIG